jgi:YesN/AraC family two-component response regulator
MSLKVVYLEDEEELREGLAMVLEVDMPEIELIPFTTGDDALEYIEYHYSEVDLYILDVRVPGNNDGLSVARRIRELDTATMIAMVSAYPPPSKDILKTLHLYWYSKPWDLPETMMAIRKRLGK